MSKDTPICHPEQPIGRTVPQDNTPQVQRGGGPGTVTDSKPAPASPRYGGPREGR